MSNTISTLRVEFSRSQRVAPLLQVAFLKSEPIFSILKLPDCVKQCYRTFSFLFSTAEKPRKDSKEVNQFCAI